MQIYNPAYRGKCFEPELVERLAKDAGNEGENKTSKDENKNRPAGEPTYLPLLQVTLEEIWKGCWLKLSAYHGLAQAIQERADNVLAYELDQDGNPGKARTVEQQQQILDLLLDLVSCNALSKKVTIKGAKNRQGAKTSKLQSLSEPQNQISAA